MSSVLNIMFVPGEVEGHAPREFSMDISSQQRFFKFIAPSMGEVSATSERTSLLQVACEL